MYPTEEELKQIREWDTLDLKGCMKFIRSIWHYAEFGYFENLEKNVYILRTAGWSGNEEIIAALRENHIFWVFHWYSSVRGGHYTFKDRHSK